ncbi:UNVERIFIED_CONTAM: hypothetical protein HDU68_007304 [Siphonaria sp. JEL0065]|nr:hypothetical protein HDU68_007304 [Siphonaria sp. JEL0065]
MSVYPTLKLTYFGIKARAEPIRLALAINDIPFEDERITREQWVALKPTTPFGQVPILTVNESTVIAQSTAILRYVGKIGPLKLYPEDPLKAAVVDQIISHIQDLETIFRPSFMEQDLEKRLKIRTELAEKTLPPLLAALDAFIGAQGAGEFAAGKDVTIADLIVYQMYSFYSGGAIDGIPTTILDPYVNVQKVVKAVKGHAAVAKWEAAH